MLIENVKPSYQNDKDYVVKFNIKDKFEVIVRITEFNSLIKIKDYHLKDNFFYLFSDNSKFLCDNYNNVNFCSIELIKEIYKDSEAQINFKICYNGEKYNFYAFFSLEDYILNLIEGVSGYEQNIKINII